MIWGVLDGQQNINAIVAKLEATLRQILESDRWKVGSFNIAKQQGSGMRSCGPPDIMLS